VIELHLEKLPVSIHHPDCDHPVPLRISDPLGTPSVRRWSRFAGLTSVVVSAATAPTLLYARDLGIQLVRQRQLR